MHPAHQLDFLWFDNRKPELYNLVCELRKSIRFRARLGRALRVWRMPLSSAFLGLVITQIVLLPFRTRIGLLTLAFLAIVAALYFFGVGVLIFINRRRRSLLLHAILGGRYGAAMGNTMTSWKKLEEALKNRGHEFSAVREDFNDQITPYVANYLNALNDTAYTRGMGIEAYHQFATERADHAAAQIARVVG